MLCRLKKTWVEGVGVVGVAERAGGREAAGSADLINTLTHHRRCHTPPEHITTLTQSSLLRHSPGLPFSLPRKGENRW